MNDSTYNWGKDEIKLNFIKNLRALKVIKQFWISIVWIQLH
jgi:hypothetical protein